MKIFDLQTCKFARDHQKEILRNLDMEVRCAVSQLNGASDRQRDLGETMSMTMLLAIAADVAMACPWTESPTEEDFVDAAREAFAWALRRHWNGKDVVGPEPSFTIAN